MVSFSLPAFLSQVLCVTSEEPDGTVSMSAKISDFGLALRAMPLASGRGWGSVHTEPRGTPAYMAPEMFVQRDGRGCVEVRCPLSLQVRWVCSSCSLCTLHSVPLLVFFLERTPQAAQERSVPPKYKIGSCFPSMLSLGRYPR